MVSRDLSRYVDIFQRGQHFPNRGRTPTPKNLSTVLQHKASRVHTQLLTVTQYI